MHSQPISRMINHGVIYLTFLTHRSVSPVMRMKIVVTYCLDLTLSSELSKISWTWLAISNTIGAQMEQCTHHACDWTVWEDCLKVMLVSLHNSCYLRAGTQTSGCSFSKMFNFWVQFLWKKSTVMFPSMKMLNGWVFWFFNFFMGLINWKRHFVSSHSIRTHTREYQI